MTPVLGIFNPFGGPYFIPQYNPIDLLFLQINQFVSITFSSRDTRI